MPKTQYKNQVFIPAVPEFDDDLAVSWQLQQPLIEAGYMPGFMLFIRKVDEGDTPRIMDSKSRDKQYSNLEQYATRYGEADIVTMLPNLPTQQIDWFHNTDFAYEHVCKGIDFARNLPLGGNRLLTFHLNSLVSPQEFLGASRQEWYDIFDERAKPILSAVGQEARRQGVDVLVETVPVPEFGDMPKGDEKRELRNPWYHYSGNHIWRGLVDAGLGACVDLSHSRTIYIAELVNDREQIMFPEDVETIKNRRANLLTDLQDPATRLIHLNDGAGMYTPEGGTFKEGVALGQGDIGDLPHLISYINSRQIPMVLEINESEYKIRSNTRASIEYLITKF